MLHLAVYLHHVDPFALRFPAGFPIAGVRWYGLSYLLGFFIAYLLIRRVVRVGISTLKPAEVGDLIVTLALGVVFGGRLGYCLFYKPSLFWTFQSHVPWWGVLMINEGGMASHGGMIGGIIASWWYAHKHKHSWPHVLDLFAYGAPLGLFFGRIANFINGELFGREIGDGSIALKWGVKFPQEVAQWSDDKVMASLYYLRLHNIPTGTGGPVDLKDWIAWRVSQGDMKVIHAIEPLLTIRHPSQLYEALLEGVVVFSVLFILWYKPRKPLVIGGAFGLAYGLVRIIAEHFREPDEIIKNQEFAHYGVTRGQWLSVLLALAGLALLIIFNRRKVAPMGSWRRQDKTEIK